MRLDSLKRMKLGWLFGNFSGGLFENKDVEVALKRYVKGEKCERHIHRLACEYTIIITGKVKMNGIEFFQDDIIIIEKEESTDFEALTDCCTLVIKTPSCPSDKYIVGD